MRKETQLLGIGLLVFISPLLGIPEGWRSGLLFGLGGLVVLIAILFRLEMRRAGRRDTEMMHREYDPRGEPPLTTPR
jgi:TRAP-type C4-dicarboxylate transport system permease small subunit